MKWKGRRQSSNVEYVYDNRTYPTYRDMRDARLYNEEATRNARPRPSPPPNYRDETNRMNRYRPLDLPAGGDPIGRGRTRRRRPR